ncbi:MAG: hypothetical protein A2Z88_09455 [Omnitrophica WOR_2 bacterium GWA2_47_8]|nr:MAG: hypothetical protein A2Z88_09455 [Omnitrophica WOR_2 bacterium GWA2_47_8]
MNRTLPANASYPQLLARVKATLIEGQSRIEQERINTYWETGRLIHAHILKYKGRAEYGAEVLKRLAKDLNIEVSTLQRCIQFFKAYPRLSIYGARHKFSWTHYRKLITVPDGKKRTLLEKAALQNEWSSRELANRIKDERPISNQLSVTKNERRTTRDAPLVPLRGELFTYQVVERPTVGGEPELLLDLGFGIFRKIPPRSSLSKGDFVGEDFKKKSASLKDLFTYQAVVEKVIDGDTLKVRMDLGYDDSCRQVLRLRGIDCPEMDTKEGQEAKACVQSYIKEAQMIIVRSSKSDKYDRYLADIFIPQEGKDEIFLNNLLLVRGYAVRWKY